MIELINVTKRFGEKVAVNDMTLHVPKGELFCFLGPNGAGKTTTIKMLCGLLRPSAGTLRLAGMDVEKDRTAIHRITGYVPDTPYLYERLTTTEFFYFTGHLFGMKDDEIAEEHGPSFKLFGLHEHERSLIKDLSYGLRQRLVYASTFLHKPRILFVDEPFVGLDPYSIRLLKDLLREKTREGATVFLTTHILALAEDLADRIGIIANGELVALGSLTDLEEQSEMKGRLEDVFLKITDSPAPEGETPDDEP